MTPVYVALIWDSRKGLNHEVASALPGRVIDYTLSEWARRNGSVRALLDSWAEVSR